MPLRVLIVEDSEDDALLLVLELRRGGFDLLHERVESAAPMRAALTARQWDAVVSDYRMPHFSGLDALRVLRETDLDLPFILVSGVAGEEECVEAMRLGAHDYLMKNNLARLAEAVTRELRDAEVRRERRKAEVALRETVSRLQSTLDEKTVLLKEVHHRVKNNLAVVAALLSLKADATPDGEARLALEESQQRVQSMALVHQHLYGSDSLCRVNFAAYARELVEGVQSTFTAGDSRVDLDFDLDPVELGIDQALPCALILNELVSNAFKYAFPGGKAGQIRIFFRRPEPGRCELIVRDDGIGLQAGKLHGQETSLGLRIVQILTRQLNGSIEQEACPGTSVVLRFPMAA